MDKAILRNILQSRLKGIAFSWHHWRCAVMTGLRERRSHQIRSAKRGLDELMAHNCVIYGGDRRLGVVQD
jgi:hypothetical protein